MSFAVLPSSACRGTSQKSFDRCADQHDARVASEQHQAVLQVGHDLVDVVFQGRENFLGVAHLAAEVSNFQRDQTVLVADVFTLDSGRDCFSSADAVQAFADLF